MITRISQRLARVRAELIVDGTAGNAQSFVQVTVFSQLPRLDSEINQRTITQAILDQSTAPVTYPDCEEVEFRARYDGDDINKAVEQALEAFHESAALIFDEAFSRIKARAEAAHSAYLAQKKTELQCKYQRKKFGVFGPIVTPIIPEVAEK